MADGYVEFEFELTQALLERLVEVFDGLTAAPLKQGIVDRVRDKQGVYQLFFDGTLVYIGKTDGEAGIRTRLGRHAKKILHRKRLDPARVGFKAVRLFVFTVVDLEKQLIAHYGGVKKVAWNGSGFGSNDPGRERDTTKIKEGNFDAVYPINIDRALDVRFKTSMRAADALARLKDALPYVLRYQKVGGKPHEDLADTTVTIRKEHHTTRRLITSITRQLPKGWQATALKSHVILYKENEKYVGAETLAES